jgi:RNA polymerase sigma factor (sigma-70 family)
VPQDFTEIELLYASERGRLEKLARRKAGHSNAADVVQDVFTSILSRAFETVGLSPAYLARATQNTSVSYLRSERRRLKFAEGLREEQYAAPVLQPDQIVAARHDLNRLQDMIDSLPARTRQIFLLNRIHNCTYDEIATALEVSYSTVEREIAKALLACREVLCGM